MEYIITILVALVCLTQTNLMVISRVGASENNAKTDTTEEVTETNQLKVVDTFKMDNCGMKVKDGDKIHWKYWGKLTNGARFDSGTFDATIGEGDVIKGVDEGMKGLCVGDERTMTMHSSWGYGEKGTGNIPGNANLIFDVQLLSIKRPGVAEETIESKLQRTGGVSKDRKLKIVDTSSSTGNCSEPTKEDDIITWMAYGFLLDGTLIDAGEYEAQLGSTEINIGLNKGLRGLCVGDQRSITIHYEWAYGEKGIEGSIAPNSTLTYDIEMLKIVKTSDTESVPERVGLLPDEKLKVTDTYLNEPCGMKAQGGDELYWKYKGTSTNGEMFHEGLFTATLDKKQVIRGVNEGMKGLCVGGKRRMIMNPSYAYGRPGDGKAIKGDATIIFNVDLMSIIRNGYTESLETKYSTGGVSKDSQIKIIDMNPTGECKVKTDANDRVTWQSYGYLLDGTSFESTEHTAEFGQVEIIPGLDKGLRGLCIGDERSITIYHESAYGEKGLDGIIPPNATLVFDIKILDIERTVSTGPYKGETIEKETGLKPDQKLKIEIMEVAKTCPLKSKTDDIIHWKYRGFLLDGTEFDKGTFHATLGHKHVIAGVDRGMRRMCVGEKRQLTIHHEWAYGEAGRNKIPPRATLVFDVELTNIERPGAQKNEL